MMRRVVVLSALALVCILVVLISVGCSSYTTKDLHTGYTKFIRNRGLVSFSFEYPSSYSRGPYIYIQPDEDLLAQFFPSDYEYREVIVSVTKDGPDSDLYEASLMFEAREAGKPGENATMLADGYNPYATCLDFQIIDRAPVAIGTLSGEKLVFSYTTSYFKSKPIAVIDRQVFLDYDGIIFSMSSTARKEVADEAKADFEHLLQTFKILK